MRRWGIDTVLIGSYARHTARYPGKDVDVFLRFTALGVHESPATVYNEVASVLIAKYGDKDTEAGGRVTKQARSLKIDFADSAQPDGDESFSIDAVPAVPWGEHWGIPNRDTAQWQDPSNRWILTSPIEFAARSEELSTASTSPKVGTDNAYCPVVRLLRQVRHVHLGERRPGGLYTEVAAYYAWKSGGVSGSSWAELLANTLGQVAIQFRAAAGGTGLADPVLGTPMKPALSADQWISGAQVFDQLAIQAMEALGAERCRAAFLWRQVLGENDRGPVLRLPAGCDANGFPISRVAAVSTSGSDEPRGFA